MSDTWTNVVTALIDPGDPGKGLMVVSADQILSLYQTQEQAEFWRGVSNAPSDVFGSLRHRFRELNLRLERMEAYVTSREFSIDRELGRK